jgi:hypothetical protein
LYPHGPVASQGLNTAATSACAATTTLTDGLVLARSVFEHTISYRSAMIYRHSAGHRPRRTARRAALQAVQDRHDNDTQTRRSAAAPRTAISATATPDSAT